MFFRVQLSVVRRDVDICGQFQQDDLENRELRLESQLGAVREFAVDQRGRQSGGPSARSPVLSQFLTAAEAAAHAGGASNRVETNEGPSDDDDEYEEAVRDGADDEVPFFALCTCVCATASLQTVLT